MKPNAEVCKRCMGKFKVKEWPDRILSFSNYKIAYTATCYRREVPQFCPFMAEQVVSQEKP